MISNLKPKGSGEELWKPIPGYEQSYEASSFGRIRSLARTDSVGRARTQRIMCQKKSSRGYFSVMLCKNSERRDFRVSRLVLSAFVGPCPKGMEAAHQNGDPSDNSLRNLRWATHSENTQDKKVHGTMARGDSHGRTKILVLERERIKQLRAAGHSLSFIAGSYGVSKQRIWQLVR